MIQKGDKVRILVDKIPGLEEYGYDGYKDSIGVVVVVYNGSALIAVGDDEAWMFSEGQYERV